MFIAALLSGTILPFSSEAVMVGLLAVGVSPWALLFAGSVGNIIGGATCYYVGRCTTPERIQKIFGIKPKNMERARRLVEHWGGMDWLFLLDSSVGRCHPRDIRYYAFKCSIDSYHHGHRKDCALSSDTAFGNGYR